MGEGLEGASLADNVTPLYRPDVEGIAYYEFALESGTRKGFVVVSAGSHDFPSSHWSLGRAPISDELLERAKKSGKKVARIYKLDALGYLAEDETGEEAARSGELPVPVDAGAAESRIIEEVAVPSTSEPDEKGGRKAKHEIKKNGEKPNVKVRHEVNSWKALKKDYKKFFDAPLGQLRKRAAKAWEIEDLAEKHGEGIVVGEPFRVALLEPGAKFETSGDGAALTKIRLIEYGAGASALELLAQGVPKAGGADIVLQLSYPSGLAETLKFFIVTRQTHSDMKGKLPRVDGGKETV